MQNKLGLHATLPTPQNDSPGAVAAAEAMMALHTAVDWAAPKVAVE